MTKRDQEDGEIHSSVSAATEDREEGEILSSESVHQRKEDEQETAETLMLLSQAKSVSTIAATTTTTATATPTRWTPSPPPAEGSMPLCCIESASITAITTTTPTRTPSPPPADGSTPLCCIEGASITAITTTTPTRTPSPPPTPSTPAHSPSASTITALVVSAADKRLFRCKTCKREFATFQALGGHRASHTKPRSDADSPGSSEKTTMHRCSICGQEFPVGQALGGHMRRHRDKIAMDGGEAALPGQSEQGDLPVLKKARLSGDVSIGKNVLAIDLNLTPAENLALRWKELT